MVDNPDPEEEAKDALLLALAQAVLTSGVGLRERTFQHYVGLCAIFIPTYPILLRALDFTLSKNKVWPFAVPMGFWTISLVICSYWLLPVLQPFDLKNITGIVAAYERKLVDTEKWSYAAALSLLAGIISAAYFVTAA